MAKREGVGNVELLGHPARRERGERGVETAHDPRSVAADVEVALRQQPQHLTVIHRLDRSQRRRSQRGDRDRQGVVRVVLVGAARAEQPDTRSQRRGDVDDGLAGVDELLSQQVPEPGGGLQPAEPTAGA